MLRRHVATILACSSVLFASAAMAEVSNYRRADLQCLLDNRGMVENLPGPLILLNVSVCPPDSGNQNSTEQRVISKLPTKEGDASAIILFGKAQTACVMAVIGESLQSQGELVAIDISRCGS
ncbi:MAG: hypothetical protein ACKVP5_13445 [Aestuariivirga sp.]